MIVFKLIARWARAYVRAVCNDGLWIYAPPLAISACSPIWRVAPPPRIEEEVVVEPPRPTVTDPRLVAARRASLRLIIGSQSVT